MSYATGRCMCFPATQRPFEVDDVCELVRKVYGNQVHFVDGDEELVPGLSVHKVGGHSAGLMCVRVWTQRAGLLWHLIVPISMKILKSVTRLL